ncbi:hypothetical protein G3I60_30990 [Streptomyces sp. SID13666]|uniref:hypothetical protein n=1 Tax=Streptomyces TaxID=1883 RepID=UPI0013C20911|nr:MULTISPECIES: hypothetical protein [Streptomyces]MCZ4094916.1 hypothetical protein [Streptomyces sp. H39-C1]NEA58458.1 hypothetical protein [Streptomyces sp. SID13666]NEA72553.1 hypothetical protein [Streptomyces sp. SID13588]QNA74388.1 hypothetical protein C8250_023020 [Streptomyces sp. So13.3]
MSKHTARSAHSKGMRHTEQVDAAQAKHRANEVRENLDAFEYTESPEAERQHAHEPQE